MSIVDDLPNLHQPMQRVWQGEFATTPASVSQLVDIILPDFTRTLRFKKCRWTPRVETITLPTTPAGTPTHTHNVTVAELLLPKRGDPCLCVFDNARQLWVVMWWPY